MGVLKTKNGTDYEWLEVAADACFSAYFSLLFLGEHDPLKKEAETLYEHVMARLNEIELKKNK